MNETPQQYAERVLGYVEGKDPLKILATTPAKLASLLKGKTKKQLTKRTDGDKCGTWDVVVLPPHSAKTQ